MGPLDGDRTTGDTVAARRQATTLGHEGIPWADDDRNRIQDEAGDSWEIWYIRVTGDHTRVAWLARPTGATASVFSAGTADELLEKIRDYMLRLPEHIEEARKNLDAADPAWFGMVERLTKLLEALGRMQAALAKN